MHGHEDELLFFVSFLASFGFIRTSAHLIKAQVKWWPGNVEVGGTHIHHLVWGILLILVCGYIGAVERPDDPWSHIAIVGFGIGTGLTMDEFALWLNLRDVYWEKEGRRSIDAVIVVAILAGLAVAGLRLWVDAAEDVEAEVVTVVGADRPPRLRVRRRQRGQGEVRNGTAQHRDRRWSGSWAPCDSRGRPHCGPSAFYSRQRSTVPASASCIQPRKFAVPPSLIVPAARSPPLATLREPMSHRLHNLALLLLLPLGGSNRRAAR